MLYLVLAPHTSLSTHEASEVLWVYSTTTHTCKHFVHNYSKSLTAKNKIMPQIENLHPGTHEISPLQNYNHVHGLVKYSQ
jgi:hypothetical protein